MYKQLNPKAFHTTQLFGYADRQAGTVQDGVLTLILRHFSSSHKEDQKWLVLDGTVDSDWAESLNSVMDDSRGLTLATNERISITNNMKMIFEVGDLSHATPGTVSRAAALYINESDIGYQPFVTSWIRKHSETEQLVLSTLFNKYLPLIVNRVKTNVYNVITLSVFNMVRTVCWIIDGLLSQTNLDKLSPERHVRPFILLSFPH